MADSKARPQRTTGYNGGGGATPPAIAPVDPANMFSRPMDYAGASPSMFWSGSDTTPPNANPAAMRGYTRNAPYMEELVSDPQVMFNEIMSLNAAVRENPNDVVSEYRLRVLKQALRDIYNLQTEQPYHREYRPSSALPVTPKGR